MGQLEKLGDLRKVFDEAMADPGFKATAESKNLEYEYASGQVIETIIKRLYAMPKPVIEKAARALELAAKRQ